jgi:phosphate transport system protein
MRTHYDTQLVALNADLITMGALIEYAITTAVTALIEQNTTLAREAIDFDRRIDDLEKQIERQCLSLFLHQQPVAADLRLISTALKMITDMERIGDHAADISEITVLLADKVYVKRLEHIPAMASATIAMVTDAIDAHVRRDLDLAQAVIEADDEVDALFIQVRSEVIELIREDADNGEQALDLMMIAKYFERIGDHAVNIAEWVVFSMTGRHKNATIL